MLKNILPFIILLVFTQTYAQNYFEGTILEEDTSARVSNAIVTIEGTAFSQLTNSNGEFNFTEKIPTGEHVVTITKENYVTKYFLIQPIDGKTITMDNIKIEVNKKERKRRDKALKAQRKQEKRLQKEREKTLERAQKEKEKEQKELEKKKRKLQKENRKNKNKNEVTEVISNEPVVYDNIEPLEPEEISELKIKYGAILDVTPESITNTKLYEFIEEWEGTPYLMGGATDDGIDCSSFTQRLNSSVYNRYIERTAQEQFNSKLTDKFLGKEFLQEGDLVFFNKTGDPSDPITHVGVYLDNNRFAHATSYSKDTGKRGVKVSNLELNYWKRKFAAGGRRSKE